MAGAKRDRRLKETVREYIAVHHLLNPKEPVTVALSGGADSVCLLLLLAEMGYNVQAAHCNFHLRGEESYRDQHFVENLCNKLGVQLHVKHFDTQAEAVRTGGSIEMAARELRYHWFATFGTPIAIAHHRDDNVETMLLNLVRGTGLRGLCGIQPHAEIFGASVIRPLLCLSRQDILDFLASRSQEFVTDSTNLEAVARRNIIRLQVLPLLETLNPSISATLQKDIERFAESQLLVDDALNRYANQAVNSQGEIIVTAINACPAPLSLLHHLLAPYGFSTDLIEAVFAERYGQSGAMYYSSSHRLLRHNGRFIIRPLVSEAISLIPLPAEGEVTLPDGRSINIERLEAPVDIVRDSSVAMLDADTLAMPLTLRHIQKGDRFRPLGMKGSRLVSDFLTDLHFNLFEKEDQFAVVDSNGVIVWLAGLRISQLSAITSTTRKVLRISLRKEA